MLRKYGVWIAAIVAIIGMVVFVLMQPSEPAAENDRAEVSQGTSKKGSEATSAKKSSRPIYNKEKKKLSERVASAADATVVKPAVAETEEEPEDEDAAEEKAVDDFDALTDSWMEDSKNTVTMAAVEDFVRKFVTLPKARQDECLHRALNLIPDKNVMLLAGILMDRSIDKELRELVFNDILNRAEEVKGPILKEVLKDKSHPCYADAAWIMDVTGENQPKNSGNSR